MLAGLAGLGSQGLAGWAAMEAKVKVRLGARTLGFDLKEMIDHN